MTSPTPRRREPRTLHFDLSASPPGVTHTLHLGGRRLRLLPHTPETRARFRETNRLLQQVPDARLTHHLPEVSTLGGAIQSFYVTHEPGRAGGHPNMALAGILLPHGVARHAHARHGVAKGPFAAKARRLGLLSEDDGSTPPSWLNTTDLADFADMSDAAQFLVYNHPSLITLSSTQEDDGSATAVQILSLITACPSFDALVNSLVQQGPAQNLDGWNADYQGFANAVGLVDSQNNPVLNPSTHEQLYVYQNTTSATPDLPPGVLSTADAMTPVVQQALLAVRDLETLEGISYLLDYGQHALDVSGTGGGATVAADTQDLQVTLSDQDYLHGRQVVLDSVSGRTLNLTINNSYFRHLGVFARFLDSSGNPIALSSMTDGPAPNPNDTEYDSFVTWVEARNRFLGVPLEAATAQDLSITLPGEASGVMVLCGGMSMQQLPKSTADYKGVETPGAILTGVIDLGLPAFFLAMGIAADDVTEEEPGKAALAGLVEWLLNTFAQLITIESMQSGDVSKKDLVMEWAWGVLKSVIIEAPAEFVTLLKWAATVSEATDVLEAIPIVGEIIEAANTLGTLAELTETAADICLSPWVIPDTLTAVQQLTATIQYAGDGDYEFPAEATNIKITVTPSGSIAQNFTAVLTDLFPNYPSDVPQIQQSFTVPAGGMVQIDVTFTDDSGWVAATGSTGQVSLAGSIPAITITENPYPITTTTQYVHHSVLTTDATGAHQFTEQAQPPSATVTALGGEGAVALNECLGISVNMQGRLGYAYRGTSPTLVEAGTTQGNVALATLQNIAVGAQAPDTDLRWLATAEGQAYGYTQPIFMAYDLLGATDGLHFVVAPAEDPITKDIEYHAFKVSLDGTSPIDLTTAQSWGRFASAQLSGIAVHPRGILVALNAQDEKVELLTLPSAPYASLSDANYATQTGGQGSYVGLLHGSSAIAITQDGNTFLVLEAVNQRIQAFSIQGTSVKYFPQQPNPCWTSVALPEDAGKTITWLDMAMENTGYLYVLSYEGDGSDSTLYRLDIYDPDGNFVTRTTGVPAARLTVDRFRVVYTQNYQLITGANQHPEPSVSLWVGSGS